MERSVEQWKEIIEREACWQGLAEYVCRDLTGYRSGNKWQEQDHQNLISLFKAISARTNEGGEG